MKKWLIFLLIPTATLFPMRAGHEVLREFAEPGRDSRTALRQDVSPQGVSRGEALEKKTRFLRRPMYVKKDHAVDCAAEARFDRLPFAGFFQPAAQDTTFSDISFYPHLRSPPIPHGLF